MDAASRRVRARLVGVLMRHFRERHSPSGKRARLSQEGLIELMGNVDQSFRGTYDRSTVSKWETGKALPSQERLEVFGKALNLSAAEIGGLIRLADLEPKDEDDPNRGAQTLEGYPGASQGTSLGSSDAEELEDDGGDGLPLNNVAQMRFSAARLLSRGPLLATVICSLASVAIALGLFVGTGKLSFSDDSLVFSFGNNTPVKTDFGAEVQDVWLSRDTVAVGQSADINAKFRNLSSSSGPYGGEATFDVALVVYPPSGPETRFDWKDVVFSHNQVQTYRKAQYRFDQAGPYTIHAEVYSNKGEENGWATHDRFASLSETFTITNSSALYRRARSR